MTLKLYSHPLASFCHKALIALYENGTPFNSVLVDHGEVSSLAAFQAVWPIAKMPVLRDDKRDCTVAESTIVIEYLDTFYPGATRFIPDDPDRAWQARLWDRIFDNYVQVPMSKIVTDRLRPEGDNDVFGTGQAMAQIEDIYKFIDNALGSQSWMMGEEFTLADCSAAPALFYADTVLPFGDVHANLSSYLDRLMARPSFARALAEAEPYFKIFPLEPKPQIVRRTETG